MEKILIVDDSEMNRAILADILGASYEIIEAEDGAQAIEVLQNLHTNIDLVLLDVIMPNVDGFGVLTAMNENRWINNIPVIMISAEQEAPQVERAYELGVTDFIISPFNAFIVRHRVINTLLLYAKEKHLFSMVEQQFYEKNKYSNAIVDILSNIVEGRNGISDLHVLRVRVITDFLLRQLRKRTDAYRLTDGEISLISNASVFHDIGKIAIDDKILNKPGKLTDEEFRILKTHTLIGAKMLKGFTAQQDNPLIKTAYEICRWHHERYDGRGYPDGLTGDEIPISAQVVALADAYEALTSTRVYKTSYDHDTAIQMILDGACGAFHPELLNCLRENAKDLRKKLAENATGKWNKQELNNITDSVLSEKRRGLSKRTLRLLDKEKKKIGFFSAMSEEIQFEYTVASRVLKLSSWGAKKLGINEVVFDAYNDSRVREIFSGIHWQEIDKLLNQTSPASPELDFECKINCNGELRWHHVIFRAIWNEENPPQCTGAFGKAVDIHDTRMEIEALKRRASRDSLTGLLNLASFKIQTEDRIAGNPDSDFMMAIFDLDHFKDTNDTYGHQFGNEVLQQIASILNKNLRSNDIASRIGGDEFMIFLECNQSQEQVIKRIFTAICQQYKDFTISVSMGIATTNGVGHDYEAMFRAADQALYFAKENGQHRYCFYDDSMQNMLPLPNSQNDNNVQ